jgi:cysteine desulfurase
MNNIVESDNPAAGFPGGPDSSRSRTESVSTKIHKMKLDTGPAPFDLVFEASPATTIYLDSAATTFCDPLVLEAMNAVYARKLGNPRSSHNSGREALALIIQAENFLKECVNEEYVIWTSGATEANNIAILCPACAGKLVTCATEHKSVLLPCQHTPQDNLECIGVDENGYIDMAALEAQIKGKPRLVSVMFVNNETGTRQPIAEIGALCQKNNVLFHVDATSAFGKLPIDMKKMGIDMLTIAGHKIYGPQGIGALILSEKALQVIQKKPLMFGGVPQHGIRPGTTPTVLCVGMAKAAEIAYSRMDQDYKHIYQIRNTLWNNLQKLFPAVHKNGNDDWPYILNISIPKQADVNLAALFAQHFTFSAGSACSTGKPSHVLSSMNVDTTNFETFRFSFGKYTTLEDVDLSGFL